MSGSDMSRTIISGFSPIPTLTHQGMKKSISCVEQTWRRLQKLHQTRTSYMSANTLVFLLPFSSRVNNCICETLQDGCGYINWRLSLAAVALLTRGSFYDKLSFLHKLYDEESLASMHSILKDVLRGAQRVVIGLNAEFPEISQGKESIGSTKYHGEAALELLAHSIVGNYAEHESSHHLQKPFSLSWRSAISFRGKEEVPCSRYKHSACVNGHHLYMLGGRQGSYLINDFWKFNLLTEMWTRLNTSGDAPPSLEEQTMVSYGHKIYVFGGISRMAVDGETPLWIFDTSSNTWSHWECESEVTLPACLKGHTAVMVERNIYIFGGYEDILGSSELMWSFDILDEQWHLVCGDSGQGNRPSPRHYHSATLYNNSMIIVGGVNNLNPVTDMWSWSFSSCTWTKIKALSNNPIVYGHTAVKLADSLFILGGQGQNGLSTAVWEYKIDAFIWKKAATKFASAVLPRCHHASVLISPHIYSHYATNERAHSLPAIGNASEQTRMKTNRPRTTTPTYPHSHAPFMFNNKVVPICSGQETSTDLSKRISKPRLQNLMRDGNANLTYSPQPKRSIAGSISDYGVGSYLCSSSEELLLEDSKTLSKGSFMFDNLAFINSYDELSIAVRIGATVPPITPSYHKNLGYGRLSRSMDSIQDMAHDGNRCLQDQVKLPGTVVSYSDETVNETCTIRNIDIDEASHAWTEQLLEDIPCLPDEESPVTQDPHRQQPYKLLILGGREKVRTPHLAAPSLVMWIGEIINKDTVKSKKSGA
ncbi:uncharacterized protein [Watersipora subatra]|uniref:uncharacterized protein isoform X2 n=1 Tax=Watersipora subatra TaxID=2589382 RepID=UPI00355C0206